MERTFRWRYINISTDGKFCLVLSAKSELADLYNYHCTFVYNSTSYRLISACFSCWSCVGINSIFEHQNLIITQGRIVRLKTKLFGKIHGTKQVHIQNTVKNEEPIVSNLSIDVNWIDTYCLHTMMNQVLRAIGDSVLSIFLSNNVSAFRFFICIYKWINRSGLTVSNMEKCWF